MKCRKNYSLIALINILFYISEHLLHFTFLTLCTTVFTGWLV